jgi:hypothetical protein
MLAGADVMALVKFGMAGPAYKIWRTVEVGTRVSVQEYLSAMDDAGMFVDHETRDVLFALPFSVSPRTEVSLALVSPEDFGLEDGKAPRREIYRLALDHGLQYCTTEIALALRLEYRDQPGGSWPRFAMRPYVSQTGQRLVLSLFENWEGSHLIAIEGHPDGTVFGRELIFVHPCTATPI